MTKKTTSRDGPGSSGCSANTQPFRPRIQDRRKPKAYDDDRDLTTYEYPANEELESLEGAGVDEIIRWVLNRYEIGGAQDEYLELLKIDEAALAELRDGLEYTDPVSPFQRNQNHARYRALIVMSLREDISDALKAEDVEEAVTRAVQEILDGELRFKHLTRRSLSVLPGGS